MGCAGVSVLISVTTGMPRGVVDAVLEKCFHSAAATVTCPLRGGIPAAPHWLHPAAVALPAARKIAFN